MPPFKNILTNEEKEDAIAYFQSLWSDEFYNLWLEGGGLKRKVRDKRLSPTKSFLF